MTLAKAELEKLTVLSRQTDPILLDRSGEVWSLIVTDGGRVVREVFVPDTEKISGRTIRVDRSKPDGYEIYLRLRGTRYGRKPVELKQRLRRRKARAYFIQVTGNSLSVLALVKSMRATLAVAYRRQSRPVRQGKRSGPRPSPELSTSTVYTCWNREGVLMSEADIPYETYRRVWSGVRTPNFRSKKLKALPVNNHSVYLEEQRRWPQLHLETNVLSGLESYHLEPFGDPASLSLPGSISHLEMAEQLAIRRVIKRTGNEIEGNLAQDVTQISQLLRTIGDGVGRIARAAGAVKRGKLGDLAQAAELLWKSEGTIAQRQPRYRRGFEPKVGASAANNWLALQYGWKPILMDIHGAFDSIARFQFEQYEVRQASGSAKLKDTKRIPIVINPGVKIGVLVVTVESRCRISLRWKLGDGLRAFLQQTGFMNPVALAWEVLPWSFVVDWALPIGPWLESLTAFEGLVFLDGCKTRFTRRTNQGVVYYSGLVPGSSSIRHLYKGDYWSEGVLLNREVMLTFPSLAPPSFKNPFSVEHAANALALLRSTFR